ncbi:MAG TPA: hypothetical protein VEB42_08375, partial [Chitinophagaceae bacterium]|nr:hypothetical protein [Chitinophagaceae bacterium]
LDEDGTMLRGVIGTFGEQYYFSIESYMRAEAIQPPALFFTEDRFESKTFYEEDVNHPGELHAHSRKVLKDKYHGEDLYTMVIKTYIDDAKNVKRSGRIIAPPLVTPHFAEVQGAFDELLKEEDKDKRKENIKTIYELCKSKPQEYYDWTFWDRIWHPSTFNTDDTNEPIGTLNNKIDYLTDKDVSSIRLVAQQGSKRITTSIDKISSSIFNRYFWRIVLQEQEQNNKAGLLILPLAKGEVQEYALQCRDDANNVDGNKRKLITVHAVQKPLLNGSAVTNHALNVELERLPGQSGIAFKKITAPFPTRHAGEFRLIASYRELVMDKTTPVGYKWAAEETQIVRSFSNFSQQDAGKAQQPAFLMDLENARPV